MKLYKELNIDLNKKNIISVVGGGGKTTSIKVLSKELKDEGKRVLVATSTGIAIPKRDDYDNLFIGLLPNDFDPMKGSITYYAERTDDIKLKTQNISLIDEIIERKVFDVILIEADGSKGLPIKAPATHEPVISKYTTMTIGVVGLDSIGTIIDDKNVHRSELFRKLVGEEVKVIDSAAIFKLVQDENGLFKNSKGKRVLLLNKADNEFKIQQGRNIRESLKKSGTKILIADIRTNTYF
ncbi:selenium cofactor biosynthesis protein YqeC [Tissierella sp. Yu-01]|uniref:selenium cofactor biosynthesis protein YqeC n=1 Tax=Tissierella sp. Yu-01 TaxID=3035694 RepID=UPI00240E83F1|nr:selenium cofactor biosynthesis protein YqeC [Tissierella sp. Yu-01]WFA07830.1 selenium cofactor biosynthesis protein YqeC [Tissierella sp. Yu-01]